MCVKYAHTSYKNEFVMWIKEMKHFCLQNTKKKRSVCVRQQSQSCILTRKLVETDETINVFFFLFIICNELDKNILTFYLLSESDIVVMK